MRDALSKKVNPRQSTILHRAKAMLGRPKRKVISHPVSTSLKKQLDALNTSVKLRDSQIKQKNNLLKRSQFELKKARDKYNELYSLAPIGYFNISRHGIILNSNIKATTMLGWKSEMLTGKPLSNFVHHSSLKNYFEFITSAKALRCHATCELKFVRRKGIPFDACLEVRAQRNSRGAITELLVLLTDISESKEYEHALIAEMDRAQVALYSIGDGVITTDADGFIDYLNPIAENLTGWSTQTAIGNQLQTVFHITNEKTNKRIVNPVHKCLKANTIISLGEDCVLLGKNGQKYAIQHSIAPLKNRNGVILGVVVVFSNVTEARNMAQQIQHQATHDSLTGLVNRCEFEKRLHNAIVSAQDSNAHHCLCYLDLDQFKIVNDSAGHAAGDELLRKLTVYLKSKIRSRDTLARHGGDEFGLLLDNCRLDQAYRIANSLVVAIKNFNFEWQGRNYSVGASIGLVPINSKTSSTAELMSQADVACYTAKDLGRNQVHIYENEDNNLAVRHTEIVKVAELSDSIKANRFRLYCQTIAPLQAGTRDDSHYELLIRSVGLDGKIELPKTFIPAAERYGMMAAVDRWVINSAFRQYVNLFDQRANIKIAINLSGNSLADSSLLQFVRTQIIESGINAGNICFEITETAAISNLERAIKIIADLKELGCEFALDDFGSGVSSFTYLKNLPVDYLKIDGSFVQDMVNDPINVAMVAAINEVGHVMGIKTIAEYAESPAIIDQLTELGVDYAQGYAISTPMPIDIVASKLHRRKTVSA
ncbi:EAL domain-containing protein [Kaarinaea lacus]